MLDKNALVIYINTKNTTNFNVDIMHTSLRIGSATKRFKDSKAKLIRSRLFFSMSGFVI